MHNLDIRRFGGGTIIPRTNTSAKAENAAGTETGTDCRVARSVSSSIFFFSRSKASCCPFLSVTVLVPAVFPDFAEVFALGIVVTPPQLLCRDCASRYKSFLWFPSVSRCFSRQMPVVAHSLVFPACLCLHIRWFYTPGADYWVCPQDKRLQKRRVRKKPP